MTTTHVYFEGGTRNGKTEPFSGLTPDQSLQYGGGGFLDADETYDRTDDMRDIGGQHHRVYRLRTT